MASFRGQGVVLGFRHSFLAGVRGAADGRRSIEAVSGLPGLRTSTGSLTTLGNLAGLSCRNPKSQLPDWPNPRGTSSFVRL